VSFEDRLTELQLKLPPAPKPIGVYKPIIIADDLAYLSGHGPLHADGSFTVGKLGSDLDEAAGYEAARLTGLAILATLREALGSLDRVERLVKLFGMVNCGPEFTSQPAVINGCSELLANVFGDDAGVAARSAVGVASLPGGWPVEIEAIFKVAK
jgi:enamine deaminase RidA (YjgF/YER057c/UK114 family)